MTDHYFKYSHPDGRIENYHIVVSDVDTILDLLLQLQEKTKIKVDAITLEQFNSEKIGNPQRINIHEDRLADGDARGDALGWFEHYELKSNI